MEPSPFVANVSSIVVISLAVISFYLMARKKGKYVDILFGFILAIIFLLKMIYLKNEILFHSIFICYTNFVKFLL